MENRLREFDFIRAFAALSVIAIHVTAGYVAANGAAYVWNQAMRYAVPLFIILSGFLLYHVEKGRAPLSYRTFLKKRFNKILWPYLFWTILYVLYRERRQWGEWLSGDYWQPFLLSGKHLLMGTGYVHLYFLLIMLQLYMLYPLLRRWLEKHASSFLLISFAVTLFAQTMIYLHQTQVLVLPSIGIPYVSLFPLWLFFFAFGMAAAFHKDAWESRIADKLIPLALVWLVSFAILLADSRLTQTHASSIKPSVILYCFGSYFLLYALALRLKRGRHWIGRWLDWLSTHSFMIFLLHPLMLSLLAEAAQLFPRLWSGTAGMLLLYAATTIITVLVTHLLSRYPGFTLIGGVYAGKRKTKQQATISQ
ncbi:acyltransferase [Brevibacillus sp. SYP-B805]|uniref:acyltransferase n=1 Tax=Brevibacillus sp. SYP-B805 TaxID=1578199 RepID=UPI0013EC55DC|nr:acyltransferase [Brevibacillus sp. SYP-B805]NGQ94276.1 acyltransferase [Brevibacillus sp. SYP-B805]